MQLLHQTLTKDNKDFANNAGPILFHYTQKVRPSTKDVGPSPTDPQSPILTKRAPKLL